MDRIFQFFTQFLSWLFIVNKSQRNVTTMRVVFIFTMKFLMRPRFRLGLNMNKSATEKTRYLF